MIPETRTARTRPQHPPDQYTYGHERAATRYGLDSTIWLPNADVVLAPRPVGDAWKDFLYWLSAFGYSAAVVAVGITTRNEHNDDEPGPAFFNFISHWLYVWFAGSFFLWGFCRFSAFARWLAFELAFFNWGSVLLWAIMTTVLAFSTTAETVKALIPNDDDALVGGYIIFVILLHYWPLVVMLWWTAQYGEVLAVFWQRRLMWISANIGLVFDWLLLMLELFSPLVLWFIYLVFFDPFEVYNVTPDFAASYQLAYLVGIGSLTFGQIAYGWYLYVKVRRLIRFRMAEYDAQLFPQSSQHSPDAYGVARPRKSLSP